MFVSRAPPEAAERSGLRHVTRPVFNEDAAIRDAALPDSALVAVGFGRILKDYGMTGMRTRWVRDGNKVSSRVWPDY